jgi:hypothetical protein
MVFRLLTIFWLLAFQSVILTGCVGTVEEAQTPKSEIVAEPKSSIQFFGVYQANAISHDKIEILFYPATGGSEKYNYIIYVGDRPIPYAVPSEVLAPDYRGLLKFTATGLESAKTYIIKAEAIDQASGGKDDNSVLKPVTTFSNLVADFQGISSVSNNSGVDGLDSIIVRWPHATIDFSNLFGTTTTDPKIYQIVAVDADLLTPGDMDNDLLGPAQGRYVKNFDFKATENETVLRGLKSNTKYYVWVRCLHKGSTYDRNNPNLIGERNTNYLSIKTLNGDLSSIEFDPNGLIVERNTGFAQTTSLLLSWPRVSGVFDHLRIYYRGSEHGVPETTGVDCKVMSDSQTSCKKLLATNLDTTIGNLLPNKTYNVKIVVCQDFDCTSSIIGTQKSGNTNAQLASFTGIESVQVATTVPELGKLELKYSLPDFTKGDFDGFIIGFAQSTDFSTMVKLNLETYDGPLEVVSFDYRTENSITINNVDYLDGGLKCFTIYPFIWNGVTRVEYPNDVWKCVTPEISAPTDTEFAGVKEADTTGLNLFFNLDRPLVGIFDTYEVFLRKTPGVFSFSQAVAETEAGNFTNYNRYLLPWFIDSFTISNLALFDSYKIGILTYFVYGADDIFRSEYNESILVCKVDNQMAGSPLRPVTKACVPQ